MTEIINIDEYVKHATFVPTVVAYLLDAEGYVTLGKRKTALGNGNLSGLGGKIGDSQDTANETADEALVRELREELGVVPLEYEAFGLIRFLNPHKPQKNMQTIPYLVYSWEGVPQETEAILPMRFKVQDIPYDKMWDDNFIWVPKVLEKQVVQCDILHGEDGKVLSYIFR